MKLIVTAAFIILSAFAFAAAQQQQDKPNCIPGIPCNLPLYGSAVLLDTIGRATCEDWSARLDAVGIALNKNPNSAVYIIIHPSEDKAAFRYRLERMIKARIMFMKIDD